MARRRQGKTHFMHLIEARHSGQTIEALMIKAFRTHGNERGAAFALGIPQQTFNVWKYRLGLQDKIREISL
jgi:hypothetical protein